MLESAAVRAYYHGALAALRHVEARQPTGRRFGAEADARWASFRGDLTTADRIDLLIRDADAQWPGAFGARSVFARRAVAEDEPFGVGWDPLDPVDAEEVWRSENSKAPPSDVRGALLSVAERWALKIGAFAVGTVSAADKLVVAGPSAVLAALDVFHRGEDLDWADQVIVVASTPAHRQLAALGAALLNAGAPTLVVASAEALPSAAKRRAIISDDADDADARRARELGGAG